jgi:hypothetical protein
MRHDILLTQPARGMCDEWKILLDGLRLDVISRLVLMGVLGYPFFNSSQPLTFWVSPTSAFSGQAF